MQRKRAGLIGLAFLACLVTSYFLNAFLFNALVTASQNQLLLFSMILANNVVVISLILLGMTFYVNLVLSNFFKKEKYAYVVLEHPRVFASVFSCMILFLSILKGANLFFGRIIIERLPWIFLVSAPIGAIEGYGVYTTIKKTLSRTMSMRELAYIYGIFIIAAIIEVSFINLARSSIKI